MNVLLKIPQQCVDVDNVCVNDIATIPDVVMYAVLCALALLDREELRTELIENADFGEWLDRDDCKLIKSLVDSFFHCHWKSAWKSIEYFEDCGKYDVFLNKHIALLASRMKQKLLLQYCKAFKIIKIIDMAADFDLPAPTLENRLLHMIDEGSLLARVDGIKHEVIKYVSDYRQDAFESTAKAGKLLEELTDRDLFYANIVDGGFLDADAKAEKKRMERRENESAAASHMISEELLMEAMSRGDFPSDAMLLMQQGGFDRPHRKGGRMGGAYRGGNY